MNYYAKYKTKYGGIKQTYEPNKERPNKFRGQPLIFNSLNLSIKQIVSQPTQSRNEISNIIDKLYLGNCYNVLNLEKCKILQDTNIQAILNITTNTDTHYADLLKGDYLQLPLLDLLTVDISLVFDKAFEFIDSKISAGKPIYVHCQEGISRSATIVIMYLMRKYKSTFQSTFDYVKSKRGCIDPNLGFILKLMDEETVLTKIHGNLILFPL